jgi:Ni/Co efflux regulator RcnB
MLLALLALAIVAAVLAAPLTLRALETARARGARRRAGRRAARADMLDPGRERRAEQRARELLRSCVNDEEWAMYRDLGFIRVAGRLTRRVESPRAGSAEPPYAYLIYPHKPIVAYVPKTGRLLTEYCVEFPDLTGAIAAGRLPDSDDVLAKWMALTADERRLIRNANMHLPGRQVDPSRVRRDLWRLSEWERQRRRSDSIDAPKT